MKSVFLFALASTITVSGAVAQKNTDEAIIRSIVSDMAEGWSTGSGERFAAPFSENHDFVTWHGYYMAGINRAANARAHQGIFNTIYKDTKHWATVDKVRFVREDLALVHVYSAITAKGEPRPENPAVFWSALFEKQGDSWKIISFHNMDLEVFQNEQMLKGSPVPPRGMYANWYQDAQ